MNEETRRNFVDQIQKKLTRTCHTMCSKKQRNPNGCFETCYEKYIAGVVATSKTIKQIGYQKNSIIAYKGYPQHSIQSLLNVTRTLVDTMGNAPFSMQHNSRA